MKVGVLFLVPTPESTGLDFVQRYNNVLEMSAFANERRFEAVWVTEHHFSDYGWSPNPLMLLGKIGEVAPNIRLGTAVLVLPLWHPLRLAEDVATLDVLTGGRVDVGVGRGYQPYEFDRLGADLSINRSVFEESMDLILEAWTKDEFEFKGRKYDIPLTSIAPKPLQKPYPPIWMAATTPPSIRSAVERGFHLATGTGALFEELQMRNAYIDTVLENLGKSPDNIERASNRFIFCSTNKADIDDAIAQSRWQIRVSRAFAQDAIVRAGRNDPQPWPGEPSEEVWQRRMIIGSPDECIRRIRELAKAGLSYIYGLFEFGGLTGPKAMASIKLFADEVLPAVRDMKPHRPDKQEREAITQAFLRAGPGYQGV